MSYFDRIQDMRPYAVWDGLRARAFKGERLSMAVVDIDPGERRASTHTRTSS